MGVKGETGEKRSHVLPPHDCCTTSNLDIFSPRIIPEQLRPWCVDHSAVAGTSTAVVGATQSLARGRRKCLLSV